MKKISLTQGKFALVDDLDYLWLSEWNWCIRKTPRTCYASRGVRAGGRNDQISMHREIIPGYEELDHIDGDGLNNQRHN